MLSGHSNSDRFIEEYRRRSATHPDTIDALTLTGETFYWEHRRGQPPDSGQPRTPRGLSVGSLVGFSLRHTGTRSVFPSRAAVFLHVTLRRPSWGILAPR
jgi:hypothetical protein